MMIRLRNAVNTGARAPYKAGHDRKQQQQLATDLSTLSTPGGFCRLLTLHGHSSWVYGVAFSPDGKRLATANADGTVQVYALDLLELLNLARSRVTSNFSVEECQRYFQSATYPPLP